MIELRYFVTIEEKYKLKQERLDKIGNAIIEIMHLRKVIPKDLVINTQEILFEEFKKELKS